jgi:hypothetical protein
MNRTLLISMFFAMALFLFGCAEQTPKPTPEGEKQFLGREPTPEELSAAMKSAEGRINEGRASAQSPGGN